MAEKRCFVVSPIGGDGSETRKRADDVFDFIIQPIASHYGYRVERADRLSQPGIITIQILKHLIEDDLVVADLTDHNPNVFYELAFRHAFSKPVIQILQAGQTIPFDVAGQQTILVNFPELHSVEQCKREMARQIEAVERGDVGIVSLLSFLGSVQPNKLDTGEKSAIEIYSILQEIKHAVSSLGAQERKPVPPEPVDDRMRLLADGELLAGALERTTKISRDFNVKCLKSRLKQPLWGLKQPLWGPYQAAWYYDQKWTILKDICDLLKSDRRRSESAGDYFKATLFRVSSRDRLELDSSFYPPGVHPTTQQIERPENPDRLPTAFRCLDSQTMQLIQNVPEEIARGDKARWVELWPGQAKNYGSMLSTPITIGERGNETYQVVSVLTVDTNRLDYFSEQEKDKNFMALLLAPFRQQLTFVYLAQGQRET